MITSRKSRKTGNTVLMFDYQPDFTVYQAVIELTIDGKSERIPFKCTGRDGQRFMKDIELKCTEGPNSANSSVTISYILTTSLTGKTVKVKDTEKIKRAFNELTEEEKKMVGLYYGLNGGTVANISDITNILGITKSETRKRIENIIDKINKLIIKAR